MPRAAIIVAIVVVLVVTGAWYLSARAAHRNALRAELKQHGRDALNNMRKLKPKITLHAGGEASSKP
jgi:hypothetical protein